MHRLLKVAAAIITGLLATSSIHASSQAPATAPVRVGGNIPPPTKIKDVKAVYPADAQRAKVTGVVIIEATIGEDGKVRDAVVKRSIPPLDQAAVDAVRQWEFTPTVVDGHAVPVIMTVTVNFTIQGVPAAPFPIAQPTTIQLMSTRTADGGQIVWQIPTDRARALPRWNPEVTMPSLSVAAAVRIARTWIAEHTPQVQRVDLQSVTLSRSRRLADVDFWFYQVSVFAYTASPQPGGPLVVVVVLPDGSVVEPM